MAECKAKFKTVYQTYGVLYNWPAAMNGAESSDATPNGIKGICPDGWHLPSKSEWTTLTDFLGGLKVAGGKMKDVGTSHRTNPDTGATNSSGFTALPGSFRNTNGTFYDIGVGGYWWSSTEDNENIVWYCYLRYDTSTVARADTYKD